MRVLIKHGDTWLQLKEVYVLQRRPRKRGRRSAQPRSSPYGMVAESVDDVKINGYKYSDTLIIPASKVSRFAARAHMAPVDAVVLIEPEGIDKYKARIYAKSQKELTEARETALKILSTLYSRKSFEEEEEETEEEASEEGEEE
ncbi:hypothetical protein [Pyrofollis japonicus]|uniref:hypothetical protein n=1 Tax=Pyrofollis japonicus TaxID=3060460 RepID=UPI00295BF919|nr:hypothetical protein [Pyrofollis japonicus]